MNRWPVILMSRELGLGGSERQLAEIARALDRSLFEPHVGCFHLQGFRAEELKSAGVPAVCFPVTSFRSPSLLRGALDLRAYVRRNRIQLVHTFDVPMNLFGVPAARAARAARVLSSQRAHRELVSGISRRLLRITDRLVDAIVVNCESVRRQLIEEEKVPPARIRLCYNGIDTFAFSPRPVPRPPVLAGACVTIGVVCALRPEKDLATLLRAFADVRNAAPGVRLVVVGSGPEGPALQRLASDLGLGVDCVFEPATNRVPDWLCAIDIFVLPSRSEALSNSLMEAMACGCCAIASRVGGNPELVSHGETGMLFHAGDHAELAAALRLLIENPDLRRRLGESAARRIRENFSLETSARRMAEIYEGVLRSSAESEPRP